MPTTSDSRPSWDEIWMDMAHSIAKRSYDPKYKVGAIVVSADNTSVLALGYNVTLLVDQIGAIH